MIWGFVKFWSLWKKANTVIIRRAKICVYGRDIGHTCINHIALFDPEAKIQVSLSTSTSAETTLFANVRLLYFPTYLKKIVPLLVSDLSQPCPYKLVTASDQIGFPLSIFSASARSSIARPNMLINYKLLSVEFCKFDSILNLEKFSIQPPRD